MNGLRTEQSKTEQNKQKKKISSGTQVYKT